MLYLKKIFCAVMLISFLIDAGAQVQDDLVIKDISATDVKISIGKNAKLKPGDELEIYGKTTQTHPATGQLIETDNAYLGKIIITDISGETGTCKIIEQKGSFDTGNKIKIKGQVVNIPVGMSDPDKAASKDLPPGTVSGTVRDTSTGAAVAGATVILNARQKTTDEKGSFEFTDVPPGNWVIIIDHEGHERTTVVVEINETRKSFDAGTIRMKQSALQDADHSEATVSAQDLEDENKVQNISGPLHSANDVFVAGVSYTLGNGGFRLRGYDSDNAAVYINGASANNAENGRAVWSEWSGLNDAMRQKTTTSGLVPAAFSFGDVGGATNIDTRPSLQKKQVKTTYAYATKTYRNSIAATFSSGLMDNGWAFMVNASRRWGSSGYVKGTFYDGWSVFMGIEKRVNNRHSFGITCFASPVKRGMQGGSVQEAYDLTGTNFYNPNWGWQDGKVRNARVSNVNEPHAMLNHYWTINPVLKINTAFSYTFGRNGNTALNWYNSADPRPDYYRYLPSYHDVAADSIAYAQRWINDADETVRQVNWDKLYQINYLANAEGIQTRYIVEERRNDYQQLSYATHANYELNSMIKISGGIEYKNYTGHHFKTIDDLLGGKYWVDIDQFAERDFKTDTNKMQNDLRNRDRVVYEGDVFGYDYVARVNSQQVWAQAEASTTHLDGYLAAMGSGTQFWREGNMQNGRYPDNSLGKSESHNFINYGTKAGATYKITGRHFIMAGTGYLTQAPLFKNSFMSPRVRDDVLPELKDEKIFSSEVSYIVRYPGIRGRISVYKTMFRDQSEIKSYYHDGFRTYVNQALMGINKTHQGVEAGIEVKVLSSLKITGIAALGSYLYTSRPTAVISYDNGSKPDTSEICYLKNFNVSGTPQSGASLALKYEHPLNIFASVNFNYYGERYLDFNPERRTSGALDGLMDGDPRIYEIIKQEKVGEQYSVDASLGYSLKLKDYFINFNFNVNNLLDNQDMVSNGFEQMRFDYALKNVSQFLPKKFYSFGRTYFASISFRF